MAIAKIGNCASRRRTVDLGLLNVTDDEDCDLTADEEHEYQELEARLPAVVAH